MVACAHVRKAGLSPSSPRAVSTTLWHHVFCVSAYNDLLQQASITKAHLNKAKGTWAYAGLAKSWNTTHAKVAWVAQAASKSSIKGLACYKAH
eukprot:1145401-Pelagomonas_calceolata.AAC.12